MNSDKAVYYYFCLIIAGLVITMGIIILAVEIAIPSDDLSGYKIAGKDFLIGSAFLIPPILYRKFTTKEERKKSSKWGTTILFFSIMILCFGISSTFISYGFYKTAIAFLVLGVLPFAITVIPSILNMNSKPDPVIRFPGGVKYDPNSFWGPWELEDYKDDNPDDK